MTTVDEVHATLAPTAGRAHPEPRRDLEGARSRSGS